MEILYESEKSWLALDLEVPCLIIRSLGHQSNTSLIEFIQMATRHYLEWQKTYPTLGWLSDNRFQEIISPEIISWANEVWLPLMEKNGLRRLALCYTPETFTQLSLSEFDSNAKSDFPDTKVSIAFFSKYKDAIAWLSKPS